MSKKVQLIIGSTRQNRISPSIAAWIEIQVAKNDHLELETVDLKDVNLPFFDEPTSPLYASGVSEAAKAWSAKASQADAFIILSPEYNAGYSAVLKNAIDYLYGEWRNRPVVIVTYGYGGGIASAVQLRQVFTRIGSELTDSGLAIDIGSILDATRSISETEKSLKPYETSLATALDEIVAYQTVDTKVLTAA